MPRFTLTTPIFYVNGPPHIGHAYTMVAADVLARAYRKRGDDVFFLTGTDEHGTKIAEAAAAVEKKPRQFADEIVRKFRAAWKDLDIQEDDFIRTTEPRHVRGVQHALHVLHERGHLYEQSYRGLYCTGCENFLTEKDLDGEGKCPLHNRKPTAIAEKNWFFKLSVFIPEVRRQVEADELRISPVERKNEVLGLFKQGIADFSISRPQDRVPWAIPLPFDETQTCYVWVDGLLNYVTALGYGSPENSKPKAESSLLQKYWPADLQIVGLDILKFHAVYWPAILLALELPLPKEIFVHGFFTVNGQKISKSLHGEQGRTIHGEQGRTIHGEQGRTIGKAIDPLALVKRYGSDATRFLLLSQFPFGASGDVNVTRFDEQYDAVLANTIGNLVSRTIALLQKFSDGKIPDAPPDRSVSAPAPEAISASSAAALDDLVNAPVRLAQKLNQYVDHAAPWKESDPAKRATTLRTLADGLVTLALLAEPLLPRTSVAIQRAFGATGRQEPSTDTRAHPPHGLSRVARGRSAVRPTDPPILFPRAAASDGDLTG